MKILFKFKRNFIFQGNKSVNITLTRALFYGVIIAFIFSPIYYFFLDGILAGLSDNSGYDASRFIDSALNESLNSLEGEKELFLIDLIRFSLINGFPIYCLTFLYVTSFLFIKNGVTIKKTLKIILFSPAFIVYLETGKDVVIVTSMLALFTFLLVHQEYFGSETFLSKILFFIIATSTLSICLLIKGLTVSIYVSLCMLFYFGVRGRVPMPVVLLILIASFFGGLSIRGVIPYEDVADVSAFGYRWLVTSEIDFLIVFKALARFVIYFSTPIWYWLVSMERVFLYPHLIFHAWGYLMLLFCFLRFKWWKIKIYYISALAFSLSYPFIHLRYFVTFLIFLCFAQELLNSRKVKI